MNRNLNADMRLELLSLGDCNRPMHSPEEVKDHHFLASGLEQRFVYRGLGGFTRKHYCTKELWRESAEADIAGWKLLLSTLYKLTKRSRHSFRISLFRGNSNKTNPVVLIYSCIFFYSTFFSCLLCDEWSFIPRYWKLFNNLWLLTKGNCKEISKQVFFALINKASVFFSFIIKSFNRFWW